MPDTAPKSDTLESAIAHIEDPGTRRALRALHQEMAGALSRQQMEIDALLELMIEKHVGSIGEFKRHFVRLQQDHSRGQRIHDALNATATAAPQAPKH